MEGMEGLLCERSWLGYSRTEGEDPSRAVLYSTSCFLVYTLIEPETDFSFRIFLMSFGSCRSGFLDAI